VLLSLFQSVGGLSPTSTTSSSSSSGLSSAGSSYPGDLLLSGHSPPLSEAGSTRGLTKLHFAAIFNHHKKSSTGTGSKERKAAYRDDFIDDNVTFR
jgi:hypothetical protein